MPYSHANLTYVVLQTQIVVHLYLKILMCCYFYSLFAKIIKITATKVMFNIIDIYNANNM